MTWVILYILGILGFGGVLFSLGRPDHPWWALMLMAIGWLPLLIGLCFVVLLARLFGEKL